MGYFTDETQVYTVFHLLHRFAKRRVGLYFGEIRFELGKCRLALFGAIFNPRLKPAFLLKGNHSMNFLKYEPVTNIELQITIMVHVFGFMQQIGNQL